CRPTLTTTAPAPVAISHAVIPNPASITVSTDSFVVTPRTNVYVDADATPEVEAIGAFAANLISARAGATAQRGTAPDSSIALRLEPSRANLGAEGYELTVSKTKVQI